MKQIESLLIIIFFVFQYQVFSQTIVRYPNNSLTPDIVNPNVTVSNITFGSGLTQVSCPNYIQISKFDQSSFQSAVNNGQYFEFTITPNSGYMLTVTRSVITHYATSVPSTSQRPLFEIRQYFNNTFTGTATNVERYGTNVCNWTGGNGLLWNQNYSTTGPILVRGAFYGPAPNFDVIFGNVVISGQIVLPVKLSSINAVSETDQNILTFTTASEVNNVGFDIERSSDGIEFQKIGWVDGHGSTTEEKHYIFHDKKPLFGMNYYRLKQIDYDGRFEYSHIVSIEHKSDGIYLYPNPATDILNIENLAYGKYLIKSIVGTIIGQGVLTDESRIDISHLPTGTYLFYPEMGHPLILKKL
jgi:hypothetical protein